MPHNIETSKIEPLKAIIAAGFEISLEKFLEAYAQAHEKYRTVRYRKLREVTNAVWISETLNILGYETEQEPDNIAKDICELYKNFQKS